ncbi:helix-turn-helix domain-containing protein [Aggregatimonas sangjinii]|uniref:Helix-turn-helix domain-containing protein n=1 Tax=Aggregatimonas sangjinii TaxID=2583587 RepID=A0A5B7SZ71_9FLAO|nr:helix-turn-helix domain-containing protein [Aggregatimonas sangjinii]
MEQEKSTKSGTLRGVFQTGKMTVTEICELLDISRATYYKYLRIRDPAGKLRPYKQEV